MNLSPKHPLCYVVLLFLALRADPVAALEVLRVTENVYAIVGELGNRSADNLGNNATFGLIVTPAGAVLVDPGGSYLGAEAIHTAIKSVTAVPVKMVINTGGQDHRWFGNGYFSDLGAEIVASRAAVADQKARQRDQFNALTSLIGRDKISGTEAVYAERLFETDLRLEFGDTPIEIMHRGAAHTPGDAMVWLPRQRVVFTGDVVYTERMLGVIAVSDSRNWLSVFEAMAALDPQHVVPGHGQPTDLAGARRDTYDYLTYLRSAVRDFMDAGGDISDISEIDQRAYARLKNADNLSGRNAQRVYEELEWE